MSNPKKARHVLGISGGKDRFFLTPYHYMIRRIVYTENKW